MHVVEANIVITILGGEPPGSATGLARVEHVDIPFLLNLSKFIYD
jgi:hypothetical protein